MRPEPTGRWRQLRGGDDEVVLAVDFGPRQGEAGFARLAKLLPAGPGVYVTVPPRAADLGRIDVPLADYVRPWLEELPSRVAAVLTFCAGAAFAETISTKAGSVPLMLLDPLQITRRGVLEEFADATAAWQEHVGDRMSWLTDYAEQESTAVPEMCRHAARAYGETVTEAGARTGLPEHLVRALGARYADFMAYLAAGAGTELPSADLVVWSAANPEARGSEGENVLHVPEDRSRLLASPAVARAIGDRWAPRPV